MRLHLLTLLLFITLLSCKKTVTSPDISKTLDLPANSQQIITAGNEFAWNFFNTVLQQDTAADNKMVSPFSVYMALSMLYNGSAGATRDSIALAMDIAGIPADQLNAVSKALLQQMPSEDSKVSLSIANSLWYQQSGPQPLAGFLDTVHNDYSGDMQSLDFSNPASVGTINSWVARSTDNKITSIISSLSPADLMVLINAIYFDGSWLYGFSAAATQNAPFYLTNGSMVSTPFMTQHVGLRMFVDSAYTLLELPYGSGKDFAMYVVLPAKKQQSINEFAASFKGTTLANAMPQLDSQNIDLYLPKWESSYSIQQLEPNLASLGMGIAFNETADFSDMYGVPLYLSQVIHKTYIDVSESGTEAAAVTAITEVGVTLVPQSPPAVRVDHPFLYFIVERQTGAILFMGTVNDPSASN
jgi:serine protease inhibitor